MGLCTDTRSEKPDMSPHLRPSDGHKTVDLEIPILLRDSSAAGLQMSSNASAHGWCASGNHGSICQE